MSDPLLSLNSLDARYGDFQALFGIDMTVEKGEVISIIGANGAGKTTLMRSISGLLSNAQDQIVFNGRSIGGLRADQIAHLGVALVPEGRQLFPSLSVEENLKLGGKVGREGHWTLGRSMNCSQSSLNVGGQASTSLSGGQQQMVAIGRALMANPELILFDEISLGLAPVIIKTIYEALPGIIGHGMTAMIVEQDISKALSVSSRVYCLQEGKVSLQGHTDQVSRDEITAAYFGVDA